ncbi:MAG: MTH1187 family thiamine-binding protein [Pseudomonadota bacterium]
MALMEITIIPLGLGTPSIGDYLADIERALDKTEFPYRLTDMGTIVEGPTDQLLALAGRLHALPFDKGVKRVDTRIIIDDRRDKVVHLDDKVKSVEARLR